MRLQTIRWPAGWSYAEPGSRDRRLDLIRGYLIFAMIVNHIGDESWLHALTGGDRFVVSAAEGFVLLSGLVMGMVYRSVIRRFGLRTAILKVVRRAGVLYALHAILTLGFAVGSGLVEAPWRAQIDDRIQFVVDVLMLRQAFYLTDVIHLYALLVLGAPLALIALFSGLWPIVLAASIGLWAAHQHAPNLLPGAAQSTAFPAFAWQALFYVPLVVGYHRATLWRLLSRIPLGFALLVLGVLGLALSAQHLSGATLLTPGTWTRELYDWAFWKWDVRPGRLVASLVFIPLAYLSVTALWRPVRSLVGWALLPLGQYALAAYSLHLFVVLLAARHLPTSPPPESGGPVATALAQLAGVGIVLAALGARAWAGPAADRLRRLDLSKGKSLGGG